MLGAQCAAMDDDADFLEVPETTPANDTTARILRWIGLIGGLGLCAFGIATALM
jgi:hypothetical protein